MSCTVVFEIADVFVSKYSSKYLSAHIVNRHDNAICALASSLSQFRIQQHSDRVWVETDTKVQLEKNRFGDRRDHVDLDEYFWIKLRAKPVSLTE